MKKRIGLALAAMMLALPAWGQSAPPSLSGYGLNGTTQVVLNSAGILGVLSFTPPSATLNGLNATAVSPGYPPTFVLPTYISGISATGSAGQSCTITITGGSTNAVGSVLLAGTNTIASGAVIKFVGTGLSVGGGFATAPVSGTATSGTATCSGTATISTVLGAYTPLPVDASGNLIPGGAAGGDLSGNYPNPTVAHVGLTSKSDNTNYYLLFAGANSSTSQGVDVGPATYNPSTNTTNMNTSGTASNLSGTPLLPNGTTATTQSQADASTKLATTAYVDTGLGGKSAIPTIVQKTGTKGGNYSTGLTSFTAVDATNLSYTVVVPVGWKLAVSMSGAMYVSTATIDLHFGIVDTTGPTVLHQIQVNPIVAMVGSAIPFSLNAVLTGDGNSHTVQLQYYTGNSADTVGLANSSASYPQMTFILTPSN